MAGAAIHVFPLNVPYIDVLICLMEHQQNKCPLYIIQMRSSLGLDLLSDLRRCVLLVSASEKFHFITFFEHIPH